MTSQLEEFQQRAFTAEAKLKDLEQKIQKLQESKTGEGRRNFNFRSSLELLKSEVPESEPEFLKSNPDFTASLTKALALLCEKGNWVYASALIPDKAGIRTSNAWYGPSEYINLLANYRKLSENLSMTDVGEGRGLAGRVWRTKQPEWIVDSSLNKYQDFFNKEVAREIGFRAGLGVPVICKDEVIAILIFRALDVREKDESFTEYASNIAKKIIMIENSQGSNKSMDLLSGVNAEQAQVVYNLLVQERIFSPQVVREELLWFYDTLGIEQFYFDQFPPHIIAKHVQSIVAAKKLAQATGEPENIFLNEEKNGNAFFVCPDTPSAIVEVERKIETRYLGEGYEESISRDLRQSVGIRHFITQGKEEKSRLHLYFVDTHPFINENVKSDETDIWQIASGIFLREKTSEERERYQAIAAKAAGKLSPVVEVEELNGKVILTIAYRKGSTHSYFSGLGLTMKKNSLSPKRSFLYTFANGIAVLSFYFTNPSQTSIHQVVEEATFLYMLPRTGLSPLWTEGKLTLPEVVYAFAGWKFAYHFVNRQSPEYSSLFSMLDNDAQKNQLIQLKKKLKGEVETEFRIQETIFNHPDLIKEFYLEFEHLHRPKGLLHASLESQNGKPKRNFSVEGSMNDLERRRKKGNSVLEEKIRKLAETDLDCSILNSFLTFNCHILRTNFYQSEKIALSFRLHPEFLKGSDFVDIPFAVFFFLGSDFRGFHVRFSDIARGGIRMIRSRNRAAFLHNVQTVFDENYNLAWTQQKKNKDIPEGGSKGTILLSHEHQDKDRVAFQKYIDSMLDLLMPNHEIVDYLQKEEYVFCGPDEGTAGFMDWAALHAKSRNYRFWSAFTTGKSTSLGGIPHDLYGMTTRSVHQYVVGVLKKLNVPEESVTKVQTGGPDGDLGSNEIKISKDKTIAIVDGSGVLFDPQGINRGEITRLAEERQMVIEFDLSKLSKTGFRVLVDDKNVQLPDGSIVESGLAFRNSFHLSEYCRADLFVPCGGRPEALNATNIKTLMPPGSPPPFKYIVEGANLFITQDARKILEKSGVILFKDASANKGGVTSSSMEVLAAMAMNDEEFYKHMRVKNDGKDIPAFYKEYVEEVQRKIEENARLEFECIWRELQKREKLSCELTDILSNKINEIGQLLAEEDELWNLKDVRMKVLRAALPETLVKTIGFETILDRLPENYLRALFSSYISSRYIYESGVPSTPEFAFYRFLQDLM